MTPELQRLREVAERLRRRAQELPGAAIDPDPSPTPSPDADRVPAAKRGPTGAPPRHWSELDDDEEDDLAQAAAPQEAAHMVPEIEIHGYVHWELPEGGHLQTHGEVLPESRVVRARAVVATIDAARAARAPALLVTVDSPGGGADASREIYRALRRFSDEGGTVVVHIAGMAASCATTIALAGDLVFMAEDARYLVHSAVTREANAAGERAVAQANAEMLAVFLERTATPRADLVEWLGYQFDAATGRYNCAQINPPEAHGLQWSDGVASREAVHDLAGRVAAGVQVYTPRRLALLARRPAVTAAIVTDKLAARAVTVDKLTVGNFDNLVPNPTCAITNAPAGSPEGAGLFNYGSGFSPNGWYRKITFSGVNSNLPVTGAIPAAEGDQYYLEARGFFGNAIRSGTVRAVLRVADAAGNAIAWGLSTYLTTGTAATGETLSASVTCPAGSASFQARIDYDAGGGAVAGDYALFSNFYLRRKSGRGVLTADVMQTSNYAEDGSGNPTAGAKLDAEGVALKCAPANLQVGKTLIRDTWFGQVVMCGGLITYTGTAFRDGAAFDEWFNLGMPYIAGSIIYVPLLSTNTIVRAIGSITASAQGNNLPAGATWRSYGVASGEFRIVLVSSTGATLNPASYNFSLDLLVAGLMSPFA